MSGPTSEPPPFTGDDAFDLNSLRLAFPTWQIVQANGLWWATRTLLSENMAGALHGTSPAELYEALMRAQNRR
ncbi:hypothetical protein [Actinomadura montaniterrae]|uniref:Uncharacterized protein n=1 Tax=Actinomadura montaniterrae TaxID=1803903 RepID=A0A6L3VY07_9ACTN|nr:hypothetical protein [Actinomadura montaniterrae]KAB2384770.1 hypothetical protein F9B16_10000 [Actinomadura montaniterrae]